MMRSKRTAPLVLIGLFAAAGTLVPGATLAQQAATPAAPAIPSGAPPASAAQPSADAPTNAEPGASAEYVLGPEDVVEYEVVGTNDRSRARIYTDGTIQVNFAGRVLAAGKTPRELALAIAEALKAGRYYADPVVNVEVVGFASRYVTVLGLVGNPGLIPINKPYRLSEILARVGGVREAGADYVIVRSDTGGEKRYNISKIASGAEDDPVIKAGDKIYNPPADIFYIDGQVKQPGSYPLKSGMTIAQAIATGGGLTESGSGKKVKVRRGGKTVKLSSDEPVQAGDVLTISERLF